MKKFISLFACVVGLAVFHAPVVSALDDAPPAEGEGKKLCGDGTCDEIEEKTGKCSVDCGESENSSGSGSKHDLCGDGTCDDMEQKTGKCAVDCTNEEND